jgi:hypothetical protein
MGSLENEENENLFTYAGTSGFVNRQTSIDREQYERDSGETKIRGKRFLEILYGEWEDGVTWRELQDIYQRRHGVELHHGQISGLLTNLHKSGKVFISPNQKRKGCYAYIHWKYKPSFPEEYRYDSPVQTKAGIRKAAFEELLAGLRSLTDKEERLSYSDYSLTLNELLEAFDYKTSQ